uniref:Laminin subunit alpha-1 n=1 Tax=Mastacembelus armatus TaxID=205130 RepID=A0A3Q3N9Y2_9TELE
EIELYLFLFNAVITSNATCGDPEPEVYCKLVEHVPGRRIKNPHCAKCDANSVLSKERHPITNAIDGTNQWWQSPSIKNGRQFHWVTITLDLKQIFQVAYVIIKAANSPRPGNWILERSLDGMTFDPWQFYAISDSECLTRYNITPRLGAPTYKSDTEVICTSYYSRLNPLEHGEIHTSLINGRPGSEDLSSDLLNFTSARYIRLRLQRIRTLNADLMTLSTRDPREVDPIVTRRYYYSIKDISVGGMCICYGHAQSCPLDHVTKKLQCVCEHNTCGENCNECCPGYHQQPWQPGTISKGNTCEKCNCHNKAVDCFYNQTVAELFLSLNSHGVRRGGGVCINCQQNTAGINCETCRDGYYRPAKTSPNSDSPCVECDCDLRGSKSSVCTRDDTQPGVSAGQCVCREGFAGRQCDRCAFGYREFPQCVRCECNLSGSINTDPCSPCTCKANVMGAHCDLCKPGFYNLQKENPLGCTDCFCFGVSDVCEASTWSTVFQTEAWLLPPQSIHTPPVIHGNELPIPGNTSSGHIHQQLLSWTAPTSFLGNKLVSYGGLLNYSVVYDVPLDNEDHSVPALTDIIIEGSGRTLRLWPPLPLLLSPLAERLVAVVIVPWRFVDDQTGVHISRDDLLSVLADTTSLSIQVHLNTSADEPIRLSSVSLDVADSGSASGVQAVAVEICECPWGYSGTSCEMCLPGFYRVGGVLFGGNCMPCECNDHTTDCDVNGLCLGCTHNTTGPHCEHCLPGFYGDATEATPDDCRLCPCPLTEPSNRFSPTCVLDTSGQVSCDQCQDGYTGTNCERCATGYYGNPQVVGGACVRCQCNNNVDVTEVGYCDTITGECLRCRANTAGKHCEVCQPGYYGDAVHAKDCQECGCDVSGALSNVCDVTTGQCLCRENVTGRTCDHCQVGFFGLESGWGCQSCGCSQSGSLSQSCDEDGRCQCAEGLAGLKCDHCSRGYYGFRGNGCTACTCDHTGGNCDPESGLCICPPHTEGDTCDRCETGHWGHDPITGCKPCSCSTPGSSAPQCDLINGQCQCKKGFSGRSCDQCGPGYYGYPECFPCGCDMAGTEATFCNTTSGVCDCRQSGECVCKAGVSGRHCEECVSGWFGLSAESPDGCSRCFCSGLSRECEEQGGLTRASIALARPPPLLLLVTQSNLQGEVSGVYQQGGDMLLETRQLNGSRLVGPLYWRLPPQFEGNQLLSYGGLLSYIITFYAEDGSGLSNQEPQVLMRGGTLRKLVIYTDMVAPSNEAMTQHDIRMTEHKWKYFNSVSEKVVSHTDFMSVLSNVQYIIIKASYGTRLQQSRISNITMETAIEVELTEESDIRGGMVRLIESCVCPPGYTGLSCQDCAVGYFRQPWSELSPQSQKSMFVRPCVRCRCSNHSDSCDTETGDCQDCQHHTTGRSCERCAPGYYGNVRGSIGDCSLCACPLRNNSFSPTCVAEGAFGDFHCTACQTGHEGRYCERCSFGYYGNPTLPGGMCSQCRCSGWGSLHLLCDALTGQCKCKAGVRGQSCDQCDKRHILQGGKCVSCDDDCTGVLLGDLDNLHNHFLSVNLSAVAIAPYHHLVVLENQTSDLQVQTHNTKAEHLNQTVEEELDSANQTLLLEEVVSMLKTIKTVNLTAARNTANQELRFSLVHSLQVDFLSNEMANKKLRPLSTSLIVGMEMLKSTQTQLSDAEQQNVQTHTRLDTVHTLLQQYQVSPLNMLTTAHTVYICTCPTHPLLQQVEVLTVELDQWRPLLRKQVDTLVVGLKMTDALETVYRAENHAHLLQSYADSLASSMPPSSSSYQSESCRTSLLAQLRASVAHSGLQAALQRLQTLEEQLQNSSSVVENTNNTVRETNMLMTNTHSAANEVEHKLEEAEHRTDRLMQRIKPLSMLGETLSRNLSDIRELIDQARRQAASIKVAVQADRDCVRSYRTQIQSSNFNTLSLVLKTSSPENLLFYLGSNTTVDYLAVEMHNGKVSLVWNVGSGSTRVDFPGLDITNNRWTRINATRFGAHVSLSVHQLDSESAPLPIAKAKSLGSSRVLDIDKNSVIHIGGLPAHTQVTHGCVGEATINEKNIGLWNYISREGECGGCFSSPQMEATSFHFDGSGFSLVQKSLRATSTSIVLLFKTLSPGGLLLYLASNNTRDFLSLELVEGHVRLTFDLGSGPLILTSSRKYNTGMWYKITLQRNKRKGYLSIMAADQSSEKEVLETESPGIASDLNRSDLDPIYIGGLPPSRPIRRQVVSRSYVGCIKNVEIARSNFDLLKDAYGVRKGCVLEAVRSVSVLGGGFVQITPSSLGHEVELLFTFSSNNQSGVLLAAFSDVHSQRQHFLSIQLVSGALEAGLGEVGGGTRFVTVTKPYGGSFGDGEKHSVIITINKKSLSLQVDENHLKSVALLPDGFSPLSPASFFIGGLPSGQESLLPMRLQYLSRLFRGCIQYLVVARALVDLSGATRYEGAEFNSCLLEERTGGAVLHDDLDIDTTPDPAHLSVAPPTRLAALTPGCASDDEPAFLPSAVQFGLSRHSHMTFVINPNTVRKSVSLKLSIRTWALDGLIFLLSDAKQMDFIVLKLMGGRLLMSADLGKGPASITSSVVINDGEWHTVNAEVSRRSMSVSVGDLSPGSMTIKGNQLDVDNRLYLGGLPHTYTTRRVNVSSSFPGCIRSVSLNRVKLDLSQSASQHDVTSCFSKDQTGNYFNGSGYAVFMQDGYKVGSDVSIFLEFRTSHLEGVFLGISSAKVDAIGLEMINGRVVFNVNNGAGRVSVLSTGQLLCDGRWHRLQARKTKHILSLIVDGQTYTTLNPYPQSTSAETNNPVYVGGYPDGVRQNCMSTSSRFTGCLRNIQLVKSHLNDVLDPSSAHFLLGVTPNSCPVA